MIRVSVALVLGVFVMYVAAASLGALAGWQWSSRAKVCVVMETKAGQVPVCDYGFRPPVEAFVQ